MKKKIIQILRPVAMCFPTISISYRNIRDKWHKNEPPKMTPMGFKLVGNKSMQKGIFEPEETELIKKIIKQVDTVINIGANIGYYCCIALANGKHVVAFEPENLNLHYLLKNIKANLWEEKIEIFPLALSNKVGVVEIYGGGTGASLVKGWAGNPEEDVVLVPSSTLNNILGSRFHGELCFMIVDIEGSEKMMLEGASTMLEIEPKPIWMIEISILEHQPKGTTINPNLLSTFEIFWGKGYKALTANKECRTISPSEIKEIIKTGIDTCKTHNFLFIPKEKIDTFLGSIDALL